MKATGFREYDARSLFGEEINLMGIHALGMGLDTLIAETERFVELARERRSALITAAVTGQIDVRGEVL